MAETDAVEKPVFTISTSTCQRYFGYLDDRPKGAAIPEECLTCKRMLDCMAPAPEVVAVTVEPAPQLGVTQKNVEPVIVIEEIDGTLFMDKPKKTPLPVEEEIEPTPNPQTQEATRQIEPEQPIEKPAPKKSNEDVCIESSDKQPNQVEVQTHKGERTKSKRFWNWRRE